jgi:PAS domain S-box-containing protein
MKLNATHGRPNGNGHSNGHGLESKTKIRGKEHQELDFNAGLFAAMEQLTENGQAAFAIDRTDRIVFWNEACEDLLGFRAEDVLGKKCFSVMGGRDPSGNVHCYANCPVMHQSRTLNEKTVHGFCLSVRTAAGEIRKLHFSSVLLPAARPSLTIIVHLVRGEEQVVTTMEGRLAQEARIPIRKPPTMTPAGRISELTRREKEILQCIAKGMPTARIADSLCISPITVRNYVQNILEKLDVHTKFAAVAFAYQNNLVS